MKWTTANHKSPNYTINHEIFVGTQTGSFKKLVPAFEENPFSQRNLQDISKLEKDSRITTLAFGGQDKNEILIGRANPNVEIYSFQREQVLRTVEMKNAVVMGLARYDEHLIAGSANGQLQRVLLAEDDINESITIAAGDDMAHMRQCTVQPNLIATGGKGRQNNLKVFDMAADGKQVFTSKNLPNDYLQLEVPVWDSDVGFIDATHTLATCSRYGYVRVYDTRKQRRPVQCYATEAQMSFAALAAHGNYIYTGTTMGAMKAFDIRNMKTFVHTYKGCTGTISDLFLDETGKYLASASLDRYVRVHHVDSCVLLYQCYVKSKATSVLLRESRENPNSNGTTDLEAEEEDDNVEETEKSEVVRSKDMEYDDIFDNMQTICENTDDEEAAEKQNNVNVGSKRKTNTNVGKNKKKKN